jgi:hypothetical protein
MSRNRISDHAPLYALIILGAVVVILALIGWTLLRVLS